MANEENDRRAAASAPVEMIDTGSTYREPFPGIALCLSGGGYRAMVFHLGALWRLNEAGLLGKLDRISSVSGGSITAGRLGLKWSKLAFNAAGVAPQFRAEVVDPLRQLASKTLAATAIIGGTVLPLLAIKCATPPRSISSAMPCCRISQIRPAL